MRNIMMENMKIYEILFTIPMKELWSACIFGSAFEGTTTEGMNSDVDFVGIFKNPPVVIKLDDNYDSPLGKCLFLLEDENTPAGYAKLQLVQDRTPLFKNSSMWAGDGEFFKGMDPVLSSAVDEKGALVCYYNIGDHATLAGRTRHGPAITAPPVTRYAPTDTVFALRSSTIPDCAQEWFSRQRHYNTPNPDAIESCKTMGCLFVPVGHPRNNEQHLQWRISLSHQERLLVSHFNSVQLKCYITLKLIRKNIIYPFLQRESLSSYHCKTAMLYVIENNPEELWVPENLLKCVVLCLKQLLTFTENGNCPNYFLPTENMFDGKVEGKVRVKLCSVLRTLLSADLKFLSQISSDKLNARLEQLCTAFPASVRIRIREHNSKFSIMNKLFGMSKVLFSVSRRRNRIIYPNDKCTLNFYSTIVELKLTTTITDHTETETKDAISLVLPYLELSWMSCLIAWAAKRGKSREEIRRTLSSDKWCEISVRSDAFTSRLKQATLMYMLEYYEDALNVLSAIPQGMRFSICDCNKYKPQRIETVKLFQVINGRTNLKRKDVLHHALVPCVIFLPIEKAVTPNALAYEMIRSQGMPAGSRDDDSFYWYDWAVVDGQFLHYFLLYLNHSKLQSRVHTENAICAMERTINTMDISHGETCLNLLGWAYKDQGRVDKAVECFRKSLEIQPLHNAALWHMRDIGDISS